MPPFKEEHILFIIPGSQTTKAQLGLTDTYAPIHKTFQTRMFPTGDGKWEPYNVRKIEKNKHSASASTTASANGEKKDGDVEMTDGGEKKEGKESREQEREDAEESEYEEDMDSDEGAVYPLVEGRIVNLPAFLALMHHIHSTLSPTLHTPILLVSQPAWTATNIESLVRFFFEQFKTPALTIADAAMTISWAYSLQNACVIDVGYEKCDVTAISDFLVLNNGRTIGLKEAGGETMTRRLQELLGERGWTKDMCEQLKRSPICEVLPAATPLPGSGDETNTPKITNPAAAASTGAPSSGPNVPITSEPKAPEADGEEEIIDGTKVVDEEGVLDVASIVASGKTQEFLAAQERKKAAAAARKVAKDAKAAEAAAAEAAKPVKLPNSKRKKAMFVYTEKKTESDATEETANGTAAATIQVEGDAKEKSPAPPPDPAPVAEVPANGEKTVEITTSNGEAKTAESSTEDAAAAAVADAANPFSDAAAAREQARKNAAREAAREAKKAARMASTVSDSTTLRKEIEVGVERFQLVPEGMLERIGDAVHRTIMAGADPAKRSEIWDSIVITGNGARVKGFKEALYQTLVSKYLISPSSATIFTSELPSNLSTPIGTGSQTPQRELPAFTGGSGVNPLLVAATANALNPAGGNLSGALGHGHHGGHSSHSQTPTSIKMAKMPEYFPEWKSFGDPEIISLGAQILGRVVFISDAGQSGGFMTRQQYNDNGPGGIHSYGMTIV